MRYRSSPRSRRGGTPRRLFRRLASGAMIGAQRLGLPGSIARLANVSAGGARVVGAGGRWGPGDEIHLTERFGGPAMRGSVIWSRDGEIAIQFLRADATTRRTAVKLADAALQRWNEAGETRHSAA